MQGGAQQSPSPYHTISPAHSSQMHEQGLVFWFRTVGRGRGGERTDNISQPSRTSTHLRCGELSCFFVFFCHQTRQLRQEQDGPLFEGY
jgi:hypothetical protein